MGWSLASSTAHGVAQGPVPDAIDVQPSAGGERPPAWTDTPLHDALARCNWADPSDLYAGFVLQSLFEVQSAAGCVIGFRFTAQRCQPLSPQRFISECMVEAIDGADCVFGHE